jgi:DNA repair exonuclease SbcCD ATPase subunit
MIARVIFDLIRWRNLNNTGDDWNEVDLSGFQNTIFVGKNGSGKSTLLDALCYVLFNKPYRPDVNLPQIINSVNKKKLLVELELTVGTTKWKIVRGMKPKKFEIYKDGELIDQDASPKEAQRYLMENVLGMAFDPKSNFENFKQVVILGSADYKPFMKLTVPERRDMIELILDLKIFHHMNVVAKAERDTIQRELDDLAQSMQLKDQELTLTKQHLEEKKKDNQGEIDRNNEEIENTKAKIKGHGDKIGEIQTDLEKSRAGLAVLEKNLAEIDAEKENLVSDEKFREEIRDVEKDLNERIASISGQMQTDIQAIEKEKQKWIELRVKLTEKKKNLDKDLEFYADHDECPVCKQDIDHEFKEETILHKSTKKEEISGALDSLAGKINKAEDDISALMTQKEEDVDRIQLIANEQITALTVKIRETKEHNDKITVQITEAGSRIHKAQSTISSLEADIRLEESNMESLKNYIKRLDDMNAVLAVKEKTVESNKPVVETILAEIKVFEAEKSKLMKDQQVNSVGIDLLKDKMIKAGVIKFYIPKINTFMNEHLQELDAFYGFNINEQFEEEITSRFRDEFTYGCFSEGEKARIDLAFLFTWRSIAKMKSSLSTNLLIMDEVFDGSLDDEGGADLINIIYKQPEDTNIIVISHKTDLYVDKFQRMIRFSKDRNFNKMEII